MWEFRIVDTAVKDNVVGQAECCSVFTCLVKTEQNAVRADRHLVKVPHPSFWWECRNPLALFLFQIQGRLKRNPSNNYGSSGKIHLGIALRADAEQNLAQFCVRY